MAVCLSFMMSLLTMNSMVIQVSIQELNMVHVVSSSSRYVSSSLMRRHWFWTGRGKYENTELHASLPDRKQIASYKASKSHSHLDTIQAVKQWGHAKLVDTYDAFQGLSPDSNELITLNVFSVTAKLMMTKKWFLLVGLPYLVLDTLEI